MNMQCTLLRRLFVEIAPFRTDTRTNGGAPLSPPRRTRVDEMKNRTAAKLIAGLLMVGTVAVGGIAPAQAKDTGWNGTIAPADAPTARLSFRDTGWNGT